MNTINEIEESLSYFRRKIKLLSHYPDTPENMRIERIYQRRIEVLEKYKEELLGLD